MTSPMWPSIIRHLQAKGLSQKALAERTGVDQSTICRLADGRAPEPRYSAAVALIELAGGAEQLEADLGIRVQLPIQGLLPLSSGGQAAGDRA